jgi:hypothetical protein
LEERLFGANNEVEKDEKMMLLKIIIFLIALSLCVLWSFMTWPGSSSHGYFYAYPVAIPLFCFWAISWTIILVPTYFILKKLNQK